MWALFYYYLTFLGVKSLLEYFWRNFKNPLICLEFFLSGFFKTNSEIDLIKKYGKWAVITGASDGIGKQYSIGLAKQGLNVFLISKVKSDLEKVSKEIENQFGVKAKYLVIDFSRGREVYDEIKRELNDIEIGVLVNNVGISNKYPEPFDSNSEDFIWNLIHINIASYAMMTKIIVPYLKIQGKGAIINISSGVHRSPVPNAALYSSSKSLIQSFTKALQYELSEHNIYVQCVAPSFIDTNIASISDFTGGIGMKMFVKDVVSFGKSVVSTIGKLSSTTGSWEHAIEAMIVNLVPEEFWPFFAMTIYSKKAKKI